MRSTLQLIEEHDGINTVFLILEKMCERIDSGHVLNMDHAGSIIEFFKVFVDKCHHGKEEDILFPELEKAGIPKQGPIGVMLMEHTMGRKYIKSLEEALCKYKEGIKETSDDFICNAKGYIDLMRSHIDKENNVLYPMADRRFSTELDDALCQAFEKIEVERIGIGKHEEFHEMISKFIEIYL